MAQLRLLTWNIWMMPPIAHASPKNAARAAAIGRVLKTVPTGFDIICFEKAFDADAREALGSELGALYSHRYGPANDGGFSVKTNSGVWVVSRIPLSNYREIEFDDSAGVEVFSRKGAILLDGDVDGQRFQIVATHLQGDDGPRYREDRQAVRQQQIEQMARELVEPNVRDGVPTFFCGDFCTPHRDEEQHFFRTDAFDRMVATLNAETDDDERITLDDSRARNDVADDNQGRQAELDYILVRKNGVDVKGGWERRIFQETTWDSPGPRKDLSYRYAVSASFTF